MQTLAHLLRSACRSIRSSRFESRHRASRRARRQRQPIVAAEVLEDRTLLSALTVTTTADVVQDGDGVLSLREAMLIANDNSGATSFEGISSSDVADTIEFDDGLANQSIDLQGTQLPTITSDLTITGLGSDQLTIDAQNDSRIFDIATAATVAISGLTLTRGNAITGAAILNVGTLSVSDCTLSQNSASTGAGILNGGTLTLSDSLLSDNSADSGGAIWNNRTLTMIGSTLTDNSAEFRGGAIINVGTVSLIESVLSCNSAGIEGGGIFSRGMLSATSITLNGNLAGTDGGGIWNEGGLTVIDGSFTGNSASGFGGAVLNSGTLALSDVEVTGNTAALSGGAIRNNGTLTMIDSVVSDNTAGASRSGGGILNRGVLDVSDSVFSGNSAGFRGGAIFNANVGTLTMADCVVSGNSTDSVNSQAGGIWNNGDATLIDSSITGNSAVTNGGGITNFTAGTLMIADSEISENLAGANGGGIENAGMLTVADSEVSGNTAGNRGGGLYNDGTATLTVIGSTFSENVAGFQGGGLFNLNATVTVTDSTLDGNSATAGGGGIANNGGLMTVADSTLSGNSAGRFGGGIISQLAGAELTVVNSTVSGNSAGISGGGISTFFGTALITNSTIVLNRADADGDGTGVGGGVHARRFTTLNNTIVAGNVRGALGADTPSDLGGADVDSNSAHNLIGDVGSSATLSHGINGNIVGNDGVGVIDLNTVLDITLADNGGPTLTHALVADSAAINAGNNALALDAEGVLLATDQRGFPRIVGSSVDIGAYELQNEAPVVSDFTRVGAEDNALTFSTADFTAQFSDPDGDPLVAVRIESLPDNGVLQLDGVPVLAGQLVAASDLDDLVFFPDPDFNGVTSFTYTATDGITGFAGDPAVVTLDFASAQAAVLENQDE